MGDRLGIHGAVFIFFVESFIYEEGLVLEQAMNTGINNPQIFNFPDPVFLYLCSYKFMLRFHQQWQSGIYFR